MTTKTFIFTSDQKQMFEAELKKYYPKLRARAGKLGTEVWRHKGKVVAFWDNVFGRGGQIEVDVI